MNLKKTSKFLSLVLRHQPEKLNLDMDRNGWVRIDEILSKMEITRAHLEEVVAENNKKRFKISDDGKKIRASQGHSLDWVTIEMEAIEPPDKLYHGTATRFLDSIMKSGIDKRNRQHVHLSKDVDTATNVGSRHGKVIILTLDAKQMYQDGCKFYLSDNGVWLTDYVDPKYLTVG